MHDLNKTVLETLIVLIKLALTMGAQLRHNENVYGICGKSVTTIREVSGCPKTQLEWNRRAKIMQCGAIRQNCTKPTGFVYHCLPNSHWNETIEVCAPKKSITHSYCAEFNVEGLRVQENYDHPCSGASIPCPNFYYSNEIFKYQQCYNMTKLTHSKKHVQKFEIPTKPWSSSSGMNNMICAVKHNIFILFLLIYAL